MIGCSMAKKIKTLPTKQELKFEYNKGIRKMLSLRLPKDLIDRIQEIADAKGWTKTDVIQFALDQFAQNES